MITYEDIEKHLKKSDFFRLPPPTIEDYLKLLEEIKEYEEKINFHRINAHCKYLFQRGGYIPTMSEEQVKSLVHLRSLKAMANICEQQLLEQKRQEFTTLLYNMNEYAQENIPPRTLVKNIKFGE